MKTTDIILKLEPHDAWVITEALSQFESDDSDLQDDVNRLYARILDQRSNNTDKETLTWSY